jgi:eukaryotic-like serine/threonine-protein kinase
VKIVGRYQIQARLGEGAMAHVYQAYDPEIDRVLAIKVLKREFCRDPQFVSRFLREARAAGSLSHPNIVTIYDVGEIQGYPYIVMEMLDGEPLDAAAQRIGVFAPESVAEIGSQLAEALRYAHEQGIVHRDIKPANIMLARDGRSIKILDFGIARLDRDEAADPNAMAKTQCGQVLGTPRYMSPEQALGRDLDGRSDLFSVGAVLYELLTGRVAFDGASAATLALQITQQDPPSIDAACPRGLRFIIEKLLAKRPDKRFRNGAALLEALQREKHAHAAQQTEGARRWLGLQAKMALITGAITAAVLALSIGFVMERQYKAMERVALSSGSSIASFVASNAALAAAENMTLPPEHRDWVPAQAFVNSAASDPNITQMLVIDHDGVIRAASDPDLVGAHYAQPTGRRVVRDRPDISVTTVRNMRGENTLRFAKPIDYAGARVGTVDVSVRRTELESAAGMTLALLLGLGALMLALVVGLAVGASQHVLRRLRRLQAALEDAATGDLDFRISHQRRDEFGQLFESFNAFIASMQKRLEASLQTPQAPADLNATMISLPANEDAPARAPGGMQWSR